LKDDIVKKTLSNGLTVLVYPIRTIPKVSVQLWYNVGSKNEKSGQRGLAHFLEHMLFKGTKKLSELDMTHIAHKLSGGCNACTSYDYTAYYFDLPSHNWSVALDLLADTMRNCTFKQDLFNAELAAVIQELKLYKDDFTSTLEEEMITTIFSGHPYHYPIIGFKQDLWNIDYENMVNFYRKHYVPNNATLVVVGDVSPDEVYEQAQRYFGSIAADPAYTKSVHYWDRDIKNTTTVLSRDVQQEVALLA